MTRKRFIPNPSALSVKSSVVKVTVASAVLLASTGCSHSPELNILGSYFPSWIICLSIAIAFTFGAHIVITKRKMADELWPLPLVYTSLVCLASCVFWLIFFN